MKKLIAIAIALTISVWLVGPTNVAQAVTAEELQAQINTLLATLTQLQAQLATLTGAPAGTPAACAGITFTRNLTVGSSGSDVKCLQALLNQSADTQVAVSGVGSPGNETTYFGPLTQAAVAKYQAKKGISPTAGYVGPLTRAQLNTGLAVPPGVTPPVTGVEGSITVTLSASPASGVDVYTGQAGVAVAAVDVKATNSDVLVSRFDVNFTAISGTSCTIRPWLNISGLTVTDGTVSKSVSVTQANTTEVGIGSNYLVRVDGLGINVPKDTTKKLTIKVDGASALPAGATACAFTLTISQNAVRGTDGAGLSQYGPTGATGLAARTFNVKTGDVATLEVSANADNPKARNALVQETATTRVELMRVNVKAKNNDAFLRTVRIAALASDTLATVLPTVYLYDGDTMLASTSTDASSTFADLSLRISKDTTKTLVVKADVAKQSGNYSEGTYVEARLNAGATPDIVAEDATNYAATAVSGSSVTGEKAYLYLKAPSLVFVSASIGGMPGTTGSSSPQAAQAAIKFNVTASGGDIFIRGVSAIPASSGIVATSSAAASNTVAYSFSTGATAGTNNTWKVISGDTKYFEVTSVITNDIEFATGYFVKALIENIKWGLSDVDVDTSFNTQTWGLEDLKTSDIYLYPRL